MEEHLKSQKIANKIPGFVTDDKKDIISTGFPVIPDKVLSVRKIKFVRKRKTEEKFPQAYQF